MEVTPPTPNLGIIDLLKIYGFNRRHKTKLVRHKSKDDDIPALVRNGWFDLYQRIQTRPIFRGCGQVVSFIGDGPGRARFVGVYRVLHESAALAIDLPANCPYSKWADKPKHLYELEKCPEFVDLEGRVVVAWGKGAIAWHQHLKNKAVVEVYPSGRALAPFTDYLDFSLSFEQLTDLMNAPHAHRDWKTSLSAVSGVYVILAEHSGQQYVGSAYGLGGIWSRWEQYANTGHGGNIKLIELLKSDPYYPKGFRFSILQVLPKTTTEAAVIRWEEKYKVKLGSRVSGLN